MRFLPALVLPIILVPALLCGQVIVEEEIQTDSVDLFSQPETGKSPGLAMAASMLLPGLGHQYLGRSGRALGFLTAEAAMIFALAYCNIEAGKLVDDSKAYAWAYAGARGGAGADDYYWENVGRFLDSDEYNRVLELNRDEEIADHKYLNDNLQWRWASDSLRKEYGDLREGASRLRTASSFVVAAMVLNRLLAFIDARVIARRSAAGGKTAASFVPLNNGLALRTGF